MRSINLWTLFLLFAVPHSACMYQYLGPGFIAEFLGICLAFYFIFIWIILSLGQFGIKWRENLEYFVAT